MHRQDGPGQPSLEAGQTLNGHYSFVGNGWEQDHAQPRKRERGARMHLTKLGPRLDAQRLVKPAQLLPNCAGRIMPAHRADYQWEARTVQGEEAGRHAPRPTNPKAVGPAKADRTVGFSDHRGQQRYESKRVGLKEQRTVVAAVERVTDQRIGPGLLRAKRRQRAAGIVSVVMRLELPSDISHAFAFGWHPLKSDSIRHQEQAEVAGYRRYRLGWIRFAQDTTGADDSMTPASVSSGDTSQGTSQANDKGLGSVESLEMPTRAECPNDRIMGSGHAAETR